MIDIAEFLQTHGTALATGVTVLLALGIVATLIVKSPIHRQRIGESALIGTLVWLVLACVPLPRWWPADGLSATASNNAHPVSLTDNGPELAKTGDITPTYKMPVGSAQLLSELAVDNSPDLLSVPSEFSANTAVDTGVVDASTAETPTMPAPHDGFTESPVQDVGRHAIVNVAESPKQADSIFDARISLPYVYLAGAGMAGAWLALGQYLLTRTLRRCRQPDPDMQRNYRALPYPPGRRRPRLLVSGKLSRPISCGVLRPTIVLPDVGRRTETAAWLRHVLLHELGHHRQRDAWSHWLFNLALPVLYFHPLYWWLRSSVEMSRELIADDWAARHSSPVQYADEMIALVRGRDFGGSRLNVVGIYSSPSQFYRRMSMLIRREEPLRTRCSIWWRASACVICAAIVITAAGVSGVRYTSAQEAESTDPNAAAGLDSLLETTEPDDATTQIQADPNYEASETTQESIQSELDAVQKALTHLLRNAKDVDAKQLQALQMQLAEFEARLAQLINQGRVDQMRLAEMALQQNTQAVQHDALLQSLVEQQAQNDQNSAKLQDTSVEFQYLQNVLAVQNKQAADAKARLAKALDETTAQEDVLAARLAALEAENAELKAKLAEAVHGSPAGASKTSEVNTTPAQLSGTNSSLDLIGLADSYTAAVAARSIARVEYQAARKNAEINVGTTGAAEVAEIRFEAAHRKADLLRGIVKTLLEAAESEFGARIEQRQRMEQLHESRAVSSFDLHSARQSAAQARINIQILKLILDSD